VPLSEYEKRTLDEIEHILSTDDPRFASRLSSGRRQWRPSVWLIGCVAVLLAGVAALVVGSRTESTSGLIGAVGTLLIVLSMVGIAIAACSDG
jgi:Protein of unknown function (DUF3040)